MLFFLFDRTLAFDKLLAHLGLMNRGFYEAF